MKNLVDNNSRVDELQKVPLEVVVPISNDKEKGEWIAIISKKIKNRGSRCSE